MLDTETIKVKKKETCIGLFHAKIRNLIINSQIKNSDCL